MKRTVSRKGFSTIELLLFAAIFALVSISFISILVAVVRVQAKQSASNEVNQQSDFVLAQVQRLVEQSSYIEGTSAVASSGVMLRMASSSVDPTSIWVSDSKVWLKQGNDAAQALTTDAVTVANATFTKRSNPGGKDALSVNLTISNAQATTRQVARFLDVLVTRVSAASFDADVLPSSSNAYKLGASGQLWSNINDVIYFSSGNVGIGSASPNAKLEVDGGVRLNTASGKPSCTSSIRGMLWVTQAGAGSDSIEACLRNASSSYVWVAL